MTVEAEKKDAGESAALLVQDGMTVGLGTGSTVAYLLPALADRGLGIRCVATSEHTARAATALGLRVEPFTSLDRLDIAIDGADQVDRGGWLVKGGGAAHVREKIVAAAADRFVVIVSTDKLVERVHPPVPVELLDFGLPSVLRALPEVRVRAGTPASPDGGVIADWLEPFDDPAALAAHLASTPGVVGHGLFPPGMVADVVVGRSSPA